MTQTKREPDIQRGRGVSAPSPDESVAGRRRVVIEGVEPEIDCGRFPAKRVVGDDVVVEADILADGHDVLAASVLYRKIGDADWGEAPMSPLVNDRWRGVFVVDSLGEYEFTIRGWVDRFTTWRRDLLKKAQADQDVSVDLTIGASLVEAAAGRAPGAASERLRAFASRLADGRASQSMRVAAGEEEELATLMSTHAERSHEAAYGKAPRIWVDRERARFSAWYELFPRSCSDEPGRHGTFRDVEARLPDIASMGFDILYLPPVHPIGRTNRKGKNNAVVAEPGDVGSPWAIGAAEGGHTAIHPDLGTVEDFRRLVQRAGEQGLEVALDIAFQCSPDHPWAREHPEWFYHRPDGTIQYAENPPKKYEDIYPINFECEAWRSLWSELLGVFLYWIEQGVRVFRVDNPHTKAFRFWEWAIGEIRSRHPDVIFLSEAFTRPKVMKRLAKLGFTQSYTYFTWRNEKWSLEEYLAELTQTKMREYFRPNFWPNTPDILNEYLQLSGRAGFVTRLVLAATGSSNYGIYGPAFELMESTPRSPGSEEYLHSEKYEIRDWDLDAPDSLREVIARVNRIRRENPALRRTDNLTIHPVDNEMLVCYSKMSRDGSNVILVVANLDPHHRQSGWTNLRLDRLGIEPNDEFQAHDLLNEGRFLWRGAHNYVELHPHSFPAHIFRLRRWTRSEEDFEHYL